MSKFSGRTDDELVLLLKQGDSGAFKEIYNLYWDKLFNSAFKRLDHVELCEEVVQDVFTKLWVRREALFFVAGLSNYLFTAVKYNIIDYYRKQLLQDNYQKSVLHSSADYSNTTEENIFLNDLKQHIENELNLLPAKCRSVYQLSRHEHKSNKEIALLLNISEKTVEGHLTKALSKLKLSLADYFALIVSLLLFK